MLTCISCGAKITKARVKITESKDWLGRTITKQIIIYTCPRCGIIVEREREKYTSVGRYKIEKPWPATAS
jgi:predicted RNA-binding Zn-ribbon protein involved in translation (DUF1610 family)